MIDRVAPTIRPTLPVRGYQRWRSLLFMHWAVPVELIRQWVPKRLEIDLYDGLAYVGLVPFAMKGVRNAWWPPFTGLTFLETNVRTYVHFNGEPGVYFLSLDAAHQLAVWGARQFWGLPYYHARMSLTQSENEIAYELARTDRTANLKVRYRIGSALKPFSETSQDYFFLERYLLFLEHRDQLYSGQVHHTPYPAHLAEVLDLEDSLITTAGLDGDWGMPSHCHFSPGVDVEIFGLKKLG